ncbi:ATP-binding SpoIIE family protein phosphatase [Yinghuangia soli]|uniref:Serine/threonine-protein phosphatase n=1 Tax=Yinghuangia soli TaxID=2908204 RepID=A0AA41PWR0_9ACTN|nr:ATP-binding SpoIIE family protein phosphatase [Yinghuangia soli]MCF2526596.1 serine/threonine-protein phosphatase [Yinghuangia soli]
MPQDGSAAERTDSARLRLLESGAAHIGTSLDLFRTAAELAEVAVQGLADVAVVDLLDAVLHGDAPAPGPVAGQVTVRRAAAAAARRAAPPAVHAVGDAWGLQFGSPYAQVLGDLRPRLVRRLAADDVWLRRDPERARLARAEAAHSMIAVPLTVRGVVLGMVSLYRLGSSAAFAEPDLGEAAGLAAYASACLDNARRHTRERALARLVQRNLVPRRLPAHVAAETAWTYLPVAASGSWFDVLPLSGARIACVVGEIDGKGMAAVSLMGQVSTAIAALAALDLGPDEILGRVHDLAVETAMGRPALADDHPLPDVLTAGCVVAVYDPIAGTCAIARAGHPAPSAVAPDGTAAVIDAPAGPPLGGPGEGRFPVTSVPLNAGSVLALHTSSLSGDPAPVLADALRAAGGELQPACDAVLTEAFPDGPKDDALLVLVRTRVLGGDRTAAWSLRNLPESAAEARRLTARKLAEWGLHDLVFTAELLVSELVTNGVRYSAGEIGLRLILRERTLACEVADSSSAAPRVRRSLDDDEGGRGLLLVAQLAQDWGVRTGPRGKTVWAELPLDAVGTDAGPGEG